MPPTYRSLRRLAAVWRVTLRGSTMSATACAVETLPGVDFADRCRVATWACAVFWMFWPVSRMFSDTIRRWLLWRSRHWSGRPFRLGSSGILVHSVLYQCCEGESTHEAEDP